MALGVWRQAFSVENKRDYARRELELMTLPTDISPSELADIDGVPTMRKLDSVIWKMCRQRTP